MLTQIPIKHQDVLCYGILLAAGKGRRFDASGQQNKLLAMQLSGMTVVESSVRNLLAALPNSIAILPAENLTQENQDDLSQVLASQACEIHRLPRDSRPIEMAASLVFGLQQLPQTCAYFVIALADMPYVKPESISAILKTLQTGADIVVPVYEGRRGNPVGFSRRYLPQLLALHGDQGARALLKSNPVVEVVVDDPGILQDIDKPTDLQS